MKHAVLDVIPACNKRESRLPSKPASAEAGVDARLLSPGMTEKETKETGS